MAHQFNEAEVLTEFANALATAGLRLKGRPVMDGAWHRAAVEGDRGTATGARYRGHLEGIRPAGFIEHFKDPTRTGRWKFGGVIPAMSAEEREAARRKAADQRARREHATATRLEAIARQDTATWQAASPAPADHAYLLRKGIPAEGLRLARDGRLLVPMFDMAGQLRALQRIGDDGCKLFPKGGSPRGLHLLLGELGDGPLLIAEGYATAATLHAATGHAVAVAFSAKTNFVSIAQAYQDRAAGLRVAFCGDNDHHHPRRNPPLPNAGRKAAEEAAHVIGGVAVLPDFLPHEAGTDWNDYAAVHGLDAVRQAVGVAVPAPLRPYHPLPTWTRDEGRAEVRQHVASFLTRAMDWHAAPQGDPEHAGLATGVATGKTTIACEALPAFIAGARARGLLYRVLYTVPYHELGVEVADRLARLGLRVASWRGRAAENPATGTPMCDNPRAVREALEARQDVEAAACGRADGPRCPFFATCAYQRQKAPAAVADVVVAAHETMLGTLPTGIGSGFGLVIADEGWWQDGHSVRVLNTETLAAGPAAHPVPRRDDPARMDATATNDLHALRAKLARAVQASPDGYLTRAALVMAGLDATGCAMAGALEWRRKVEGALHPGMSEEARREAVQKCAGNAAIPALAALWKAAHELLEGRGEATGHVELMHREDGEGRRRELRLNSMQAVAEKVLALPMLLLDATLPAELLPHRLPRLTVLAEVRAMAPHMRVHQLTGGFGKTSIIPHEKVSPAENQRRHNRIAELRDFIVLQTGGERALLVTYQDLEPHFAGIPGLELAHFNAVAGRDEWRDVRHLIVIGRPAARAEDVRRLTAALTGRPVLAEEPQPVARGAAMRDGSVRPVLVRAYADPEQEAVRAAITDAELVQVIGRGRGLNRTAADPLDVWVLAGDVVLTLPLDTLEEWRDVAPGPFARMAAQGVVLTSPADAARAYRDLFPTPEAAKKALQRDAEGRDFGDIPLWRVPIGECPRNSRLCRLTYRPAGRGQQTRTAWARQDRLPALRAWLEAVTGAELVLFQVSDPPPPRQEAAAPDPGGILAWETPPLAPVSLLRAGLGGGGGASAPIGWPPCGVSRWLSYASGVGLPLVHLRADPSAKVATSERPAAQFLPVLQGCERWSTGLEG